MAVSEADRIKRAEEIYYKRRYNNYYRGYEESKKKKSFLKWFLGKVAYISLIVACVYGYENREYLISNKFKTDINNFINTPINIEKIINQMFIKNEESVDIKENNIIVDELNELTNVVNELSQEVVKTNSVSAEIMKMVYVKSDGKVENKEVIKEETTEEYIKRICKFRKPVTGKVSSRYGIRESKYKNVSKNHTGIDIAATTGTNIYSAIEGTVVEVSSQGNYGKHLKIQSSKDYNIVTLYAHCSKILVKKGDKVKIGQKIAKVGSTGNTTGPHLHFEIRYKNKCINPERILEF